MKNFNKCQKAYDNMEPPDEDEEIEEYEPDGDEGADAPEPDCWEHGIE